MRAFSILSLAIVAIVSLVPSTFAAPIANAKAGAVAGARASRAPASAAVGTKLQSRLLGIDATVNAIVGCDAQDDDEFTAILRSLKVNLGVQINRLNGLTRETATKDNIRPILSTCASNIADAAVQIRALAGTGKIYNAMDCASLLSGILAALGGALAFVLGTAADPKALLDMIASAALGNCLCELISAVVSVVPGLLLTLVPLVLYLSGTLVSLGLGIVGQLLTIC